MTSILFLVETIQCKQFRCLYGKNQKVFLYFYVHFSNLNQILNICQKDDSHSLWILEIAGSEKRGYINV